MIKIASRRTLQCAAKPARVRIAIVALAFVIAPRVLSAAETSGDSMPPATARKLTQADFYARANRLFFVARARYQSQKTNSEAAWQFSRACFDLADAASGDNERAEIADTGISVARGVLAHDTSLVEAHYYLAMNLGELARTKTLGALRIVGQMETEFAAARALDETYDYAGPDRNLGLLYLEAPSIGSIGSRTKARQHLRRAVELAPDYPENHLNLLEAYWRWSDKAGAARELKALEDLWPAAQKKLTGDAWDPSWVDWEKRFASAKKKLEDSPKPVESPRSSENKPKSE